MVLQFLGRHRRGHERRIREDKALVGLRIHEAEGTQYLHAWLQGSGCVPLYGLMEDAATAEISRTQVWQWLTQGARLDDGRVVTHDLVRTVMAEEMSALRAAISNPDALAAFDTAATIFERMATADTLEDFLTLPAYRALVAH